VAVAGALLAPLLHGCSPPVSGNPKGKGSFGSPQAAKSRQLALKLRFDLSQRAIVFLRFMAE
jgi:hypothetical protein